MESHLKAAKKTRTEESVEGSMSDSRNATIDSSIFAHGRSNREGNREWNREWNREGNREGNREWKREWKREWNRGVNVESDSSESGLMHVLHESIENEEDESLQEAEELEPFFEMPLMPPQILSLQHPSDTESMLSGHSTIASERSTMTISSAKTLGAKAVRQRYSGAIISLTLKKFMCHEYKEFRFHENINIITGRNGSGKSAIVAGIIICLGGRALITKRAAELQGLAKDGCKMWELSLVLNNEGWNPYNIPVFGKRIVIKRELQNGRASLKILGEAGTVISRKYQDLENLKSHFGIQIDNPCNVMDQDSSRVYLRSADPYKQYEMFARAMLLKQIEEDIKEIRTHVSDAEYTIRMKKEILNRQRMAVSVFDQERASLTRLEEQLMQAEKEAVWAKIIESEKTLANVAQELNNRLSALEVIDTELQDRIAKASTLSEELKKIEDSLKSAKLIYSSHYSALESVNEQILSITIQISENMASIRSTTETHRETEHLLKEKQKQMERALALSSRREDTLLLKTRLTKLEERKNYLEAQMSHLPLDDVDPSIALKKDMQYLFFKRSELLQKMKKGEEDLANIMSDAERKPAMLHWKMPHLIQRIRQNEARFQSLPIGPIALYIRITSREYIKPVVSCLQKVLSSFIVENIKDELLLKSLAREVQSPVTVIVRKREPRFQLQPPKMYPRVFPLINHVLITDEYIRDSCIDMCQMETAYISTDAKTALMAVESNPGLNKIYLQDGRILQKSRHSTAITPAMHGSRLHQFFDEDINTQGHYEREKREITINLQAIDDEILSKQDELSAANAAFNSNKELRSRLKEEIEGIKQEIRHIQDRIQEAEDTDPDVERQFIRSLQADIEDMIVKIRTLEEEKHSLEREKDSVQRKRKKMDQDLQSASGRIAGIEEQKFEIQQGLDSLKLEIASITSEKERTRDVVTKLESGSTEKSKKLQHDQEDAYLKYGNRIETNKSPPECAKNYLRLRDAIEKETKRFGIDREAFSRQMERKRKLDDFDAKINNMEGLGRILLSKSESCEENLSRIRTSLGRTINIVFGRNLSLRGLAGRVDIDHQKKALVMKVNPTSVKDVNRPSCVVELSGGERSFTTVSFLISLWSEVYSPFIIADELDVYMDDNTRRISLGMILQYCRSLGIQRQFIFISPLDMSFIERGPDIGILQM